MIDNPNGWAKVIFPLKVEDDWPPVNSERLWAAATSEPSEFEVRNVPFFATNVAWGDVIHARPNALGELEVTAIVRDGGHFTIRIAMLESIDAGEVFSSMRKLGASAFQSRYAALIAIDVPNKASYPVVSAQIFAWRDSGRIEVEESKRP